MDGSRLPDGVEDAVLNRQQLADAFSVSVNALDKWVTQGMPVLETGANGRPYRFRLSACWSWRQGQTDARAAADEKAKRAVAQMRLALLGGSSGDGVESRQLSAKERAELYAAEVQWTRLVRERGELVPLAEVTELLEASFGLVRAAILEMPDRVSREAGLDGPTVEKIVRIGDEILSQLVTAASDYADRRDRMLEQSRAQLHLEAAE
jgi:phage terminase Nu1 subunit (DNA packaging protein)